MRINRRKVIGGLIIALVLVFYSSFLFHKVNLVTADIGRHIVNGRELVENHHLLKTNFYSYTEPDFPVINHHWASGAIFYLLWKMAGFVGLQVFFISLSLLTFLMSFFTSVKRAGFGLSGLLSLGIIPLLAERTEIRPEIFSYFFVMLFFWILWLYQKRSIPFYWLLILPILEILWVNLHIFFFLGPLMIFAFLLEEVSSNREDGSRRIKLLGLILLITTVGTLINPFGLKALAEPFMIMKDYGYRVLENQSVWFLQGRIKNPNLVIFELVFIFLLASYLFLIFKNRRAFSLASFLIAGGASLSAWLMIRNFTLFALLVFPIIAGNFALAFPKVQEKFQKLALFFLFILVIISASGNLAYLFPYWNKFGLGLEKQNDTAAQFLKEQKIAGPILNNYDIGSYLIYYLFPEYRVFVDNRPEAYSVSFFRETYIPMQEDENKWEQIDKRYNFNSIFFSINDATPWGQKFLIGRVLDREWAPVYVDNYAIIFLKRNEQNSSVIEKYEIPKDAFRIVNTAS